LQDAAARIDPARFAVRWGLSDAGAELDPALWLLTEQVATAAELTLHAPPEAAPPELPEGG
jgi:hypothetical protein